MAVYLGSNAVNMLGGQPSGGGGGGTPSLQTKSKTYTPTTSQQTESVSADSGYDGLDTVNITVNAMPSGTAGTPTATKGTVSNHQISVTPSVTNTSGYISGGTINGTAVTVSASELVSGSETKTENGTYDVTNLAELVVNVSGGGGGASNVVTGTFKGTTTGAAMDVTLNYTGSGFPVALLIYPGGGKTSIQSINQRYIIENLYCVKDYLGITPQYSGRYQGMDTGDLCFIYRNAATGSTSHSRYASYSEPMYNDQAATGSQSAVIRFRSSTKMSVFIAGTSYGFVANVDYKYWVIYSS